MNLIEEYNREAAGRCYEIDEGPEEPPRFDPPAVKLDHRGTTEGKTAPPAGGKAQLHQQLMWSARTIHKNTVAAKLRSIGRITECEKLEKCHTFYTVAVCNSCGTYQKFPNRCDLFYCDECQPRRSSDRQKAVEWWANEIHQPKHVILTVKNVPELNRLHVLEFKKWFKKLRTSAFAKNWLGGFYCLEVTKENRGWHLHLHALINAGWIDAFQLSAHWEKITNGMGKIVKVRDARAKSYLHEVTKYVVKGAQLAAWTPEEIATFIDAFQRVQTFGVFGSLYGMRTEFAEWFKLVRKGHTVCSCGCEQFRFMTEHDFLTLDLLPEREIALPPPKQDHTLTFEFARPLDIGPR